MKLHRLFVLVALLAANGVMNFHAYCASANPALLKAKEGAESKGYTFIANHDEIVSKAKEERKLRVQSNLLGSVKSTTEAFRKKYPFIDLHVETIRTIEEGQRSLLEVKAGSATDWDIMRIQMDFYSDWLPHVWRIDLAGMAEQSVLTIPPPMIDPKNRNVVGIQSQFQVAAYNKTLLSQELVPKTWEDMLKPELKGRKFAADIYPQEVAALVPAWGLEKTLDFARKLAAQQPIWIRGTTRGLAGVGAGEIPLFIAPHFGAVKRQQRKEPAGLTQFVVLEPVPVRFGTEQGILASSRNRHAALLWLEFIVSPEAQKLIDEYEPLTSSFYVRGSVIEQELRGKKLSLVSWDENPKLEQWIAKIFEAYGFPKASDAK